MTGDSTTSLAGALTIAAPPRPDGYRPLAEATWRWWPFRPPEDDEFLYIFTAARRLDTAHELFERVRAGLKRCTPKHPAGRRRILSVFGRAELGVVALDRAFRMGQRLGGVLNIDHEFPLALLAKTKTLEELREAYEHVDDRARGLTRAKGFRGRIVEDPEAFSAFNFDSLLKERRLTYECFRLASTRKPQP
jgi:hypothetical protein